jgi:hypothetical protein
LAQITPLEDVAQGSKEILNRSTGNVYETIRLVNMKVGEIAARMLGQEHAKETSA